MHGIKNNWFVYGLTVSSENINLSLGDDTSSETETKFLKIGLKTFNTGLPVTSLSSSQVEAYKRGILFRPGKVIFLDFFPAWNAFSR